MGTQRGENFWLNGKILPTQEAKVDMYSNTLHYGFGAFEGIRCYSTPNGPAIFRLRDHMKRLVESWKAMGMEPQYSPEELADAAVQTVKGNRHDECYIRPIIFLTDISFDPSQCTPNCAIITWVWKNFFEPGHGGLRIMVSSFSRPHINSTLSKAKITGAYYNSMLARGVAKKAGFHDAIMLDTGGLVCEGSGENIFIVKNGRIITPRNRGILEGLTRDVVIEIAKGIGIEAEQADITREQLYSADEVFLTGTAAEIEPVAEIDFRKIGDGKKGPITARIREKYMTIVHGNDADYEKYLTYVNEGKP